MLMSQNQLAGALGISKGQCSKLVARGMPTDSVEAAAEWRRRNLDPSWAKQTRAPRAEHRLPPAPPDRDPANPLEAMLRAVVGGVVPLFLFDPMTVARVADGVGLPLTPPMSRRLAVALADEYRRIVRETCGFDDLYLQLPAAIERQVNQA